MNIDLANLPTDVAALHEMIRGLVESAEEREKANAALLHRLAVIERFMFGHKSERVVEGQQEIPFDPTAVPPQPASPPSDPEDSASQETSSNATKRKGAHGRRKIPDDLPRVDEVIPVPPEEMVCNLCGEEKTEIGEEVSEQLDLLPGHIFVRRRRRKKCACPRCEGNISIAPKPQDSIEGGLPAEGLLSEIIVGKFDDHIPLYRLEEIFARHGVEIPRSDQCDWLRECAKLLSPITRAMHADVLLSYIIRLDETTVPVQDPLGGPTRTGRLWAYLGDEQHPHVVFDYTPNRSSDGPRAFLAGFQGRYAQADAYKGHDFLFKPGAIREGTIIEVGCNAHARRKAYEARASDSLNSHAVIAFYRQLYKVEEEARGRSPDERTRIREEKARPIWNGFRKWLESALPTVLPKSPMGEALGYLDGQWCALTRYLEDGRLQIDNNDTERVLRSVAIGRKNWLFAGNDKAAARHAVFYTLIETCHRHEVNTWLYIQDVLKGVGTTPQSEIAELYPHRWKLRHPTAALPALDRR